MLSTSQMIDRLSGMVGTNDLSEWETGFVQGLIGRKDASEVTKLTARQLEILVQLHDTHFARSDR